MSCFGVYFFNSPVPTGTDCSCATVFRSSYVLSRPYGDGLFYWNLFRRFRKQVPSLRGRIVPVLYGGKLSTTPVPSLRGRIVLPILIFIAIMMRPVPTGTDCSDYEQVVKDLLESRPYGDGLFCHPKYQSPNKYCPVPTGTDCSIIMCTDICQMLCPVPTGTDCSTSTAVTRMWRRSRPYGDGLFQDKYNQ